MSVYYQIRRLENKEYNKVNYPKNWLDYYSNVTYIAKYDYLSQISNEFDYVDRINKCIERDERDKVQRLLSMRDYHIFNSTEDFDIFEIQINLTNIKFGIKEIQPWNRRKENLDLIKDIQKNFYSIVENWIYNKLLTKNHLTFSDIDDDLVQDSACPIP